jgi:lipopolysaccharide/colanic/teichoic acid biosynthesis glycosyltransferase
MKRSMDVVLASIAVIMLLPLMLLIAIGVYISNPGPIFFVQKRVGLAGSLFEFAKFRSMVVGADKMRQDILGTPDEEMANRYKNDPRIYPFGRILRRLSLDELPQLFTVIRGKMSLVGPRPLLIEELDLLGDEDHRRHLTKPGLTGLWQINGRKETTWDERIQLDLRYVHNWSIGLDIGIIIKTIKVVLTGHGSY